MAFASRLFAPPAPKAPVDFWDEPPITGGGNSDPDAGVGENPAFATNSWDVVFLNGEPLPGLCKIKAEPVIKFDKKKPPGDDGLTITAQGYLPGPVQIEVLLWTKTQWELFQEIAAKIWTKPKRGGVIKAIDIGHPGCNLWGIKSIVIEGVSVPEDGPIPQSKIVRIKAVEFLPPDAKKKTNTIKAAGDLPIDKHLDPAKNRGGKSPGETDTGPTGAAKDTSPGAK